MTKQESMIKTIHVEAIKLVVNALIALVLLILGVILFLHNDQLPSVVAIATCSIIVIRLKCCTVPED